MAENRVLGESDWEDEDLLTHEEAGVRLREEIEREKAAIRAAGGDEAEAAARRARIAAMGRRLARIDTALSDDREVDAEVGQET
jgi:hypothetical protein